jgi:uncharacterized membrane-anchored protein
MSALKFENQITDIFDEKINMFKNIFFFTTFSTDLDDIENSFHSSTVECSTSITESEVIMIINRIALDKTSSLDDIINRLIKTCSSVLIKLLISLFQICITHAYHLITLKTVNTITLKKTKKSDYITSKVYRFIAFLNTKKSHEVDNEQENIVTDEKSSTSIRLAHECAIR